MIQKKTPKTIGKKTKFKKNYKRKKLSSNLFSKLHVKSSYKNTLISLTKRNGNVLKQWSTKALKKTKFKKNTPYNVQLITRQINHFIRLKKIRRMNVYLNGRGTGRFGVLKNIDKAKWKRSKSLLRIRYIFDTTKLPFNGCRQKKVKRR